MKRILLSLLALCLGAASQAQSLPHLAKVGQSLSLIVDGSPMVLRAGELNNSTASSIRYMEEQRTFERLKALNLNSVIATASWELVEPVEGEYNFAEVDYIIEQARKHDMKVMLLWFGTFKNPFMTYAPSWVKQNPKKYPRAKDADGNDLEMPSVFSEAVLKADARAYVATLEHIKKVDTDNTVVMIQIENEPGLRGTPRDYSPLAEKAWRADVPEQLVSYLKQNASTLQPDIKKAWEANGKREKGNWEELFGKSLTTDDGTNPILNQTEHFFTAYAFARYLDYMAIEGKRVLPLPTFVNSSVFRIDSRGISLGNGCSIPEFFDLYKAGAPNLDILTPNSYMQQLDQICEAFSWKGNPILIPESTVTGARALYSVGEWDAIAFSPFGIDSWAEGVLKNPSPEQQLFSDTYGAMAQMESLIEQHLGKESMRGVYIYNTRKEDTVTIGDYDITVSRGRSFDIGAMMAPTGSFSAEKREEPRFEGGAIIIQTQKDEFYVVGYGLNANFTLREGVKHSYCGYDAIDEGVFENGEFVEYRRLNGDERNVFLADGKITTLRVKMYHY